MLNQVHPRCHRLGGAEVGGEPGLAEQVMQSSFFPYKAPCLLICHGAVGGTAQSSAVCVRWVLSHCHRSLHLRRMLELMQLHPLLLWYRWRQWSQTVWQDSLGAPRLIRRESVDSPSSAPSPTCQQLLRTMWFCRQETRSAHCSFM